MHAARALARTLNGDATRVAFPVMPVVVKTPAAPAVVVPHQEGEWRIDPTGEDSLFQIRYEPETARDRQGEASRSVVEVGSISGA